MGPFIRLNVASFRGCTSEIRHHFRELNNEEHIASACAWLIALRARINNGCLHSRIEVRQSCAEIILDKTTQPRGEKGAEKIYPVGGLPPLLLGWYHGLGGHRPAPEHFVVMDGDVRLLRQRPVQPDVQQTLVGQCGVADPQAGRPGRGGRVCQRECQLAAFPHTKPKRGGNKTVMKTTHLEEKVSNMTKRFWCSREVVVRSCTHWGLMQKCHGNPSLALKRQRRFKGHIFRRLFEKRASRSCSAGRHWFVCFQAKAAATRFSLSVYAPQGRPAGRRSG